MLDLKIDFGAVVSGHSTVVMAGVEAGRVAMAEGPGVVAGDGHVGAEVGGAGAVEVGQREAKAGMGMRTAITRIRIIFRVGAVAARRRMPAPARLSTASGGGTPAALAVNCGKSARSKAKARISGRRARAGLTVQRLRSTASGGGGLATGRLYGTSVLPMVRARRSGPTTSVKLQGILVTAQTTRLLVLLILKAWLLSLCYYASESESDRFYGIVCQADG